MPKKKRKKKQSPSRGRRLFRRLLLLFALLYAAFLAICDWYVHQPRDWRLRAESRLGKLVAGVIADQGDAVADWTDALGLTGVDVTAQLAGFSVGDLTSYAGLPKAVAAPSAVRVMPKTGFTIGYGAHLRCPLWVTYRLHEVDSFAAADRPSGFKPDPAATIKVTHSDYTHSGFDRGHLAPNFAIATRFGRKAQLETFYTSNIVPQEPALNQGVWRKLEHRVATGYAQWRGVTWTVTGPIYDDEPERLSSDIAIPAAFYKIIVSEKNGQIWVMPFIMPQETPRGKEPRRFLVSVDEIEAQTGLDFFTQLPDELEKKIEAGVPTRLWPIGVRGAREVSGRFITRLAQSIRR